MVEFISGIQQGPEWRYTYDNASSEAVCVSVSVRRCEVQLENLLIDPGVAHGVEDGHSDPEPDVEAGENSTEVPAGLAALHASADRHSFFVTILTMIQLINY